MMNYYQKKSSNHGRSSSKSSSRRRSSGGDSSGSISRRKLISVDSRVESAYYEEEDDDVHNTSRSNRLHPRTSSKNRTNNKTRKDNIAVTLPRLLDISTTSSGGTSTSSGSSSNGSSDSDNSRSDDEEQEEEQEELVVAAVAQRMKGTSSPNKKQQVKELVKKNRGGSKTTTSALEKNANANNAHYGGYLHNMIFKNNKKDHNKDTGPTIYSSNYGGDREEEDEDDDINTDINASRISTTNHTRYTVESNTSTRYSSNSNDTTTTSNTSRSYYNTSKHATNRTTGSTHGSSVLSDVFEDVVAFDERKYDDRKETKKTKKSSSSSSNNNNGSSRRLQNTKNYQEESSSVSNSDDNGDLTSVSSDGDSSFDASARRQRQGRGRGRGRSSTKRGGQRSFITKGLLKQEQAAKRTTSSSPSKSSRASTTPRSSSRVVSPSTTNIKNTNKDVAIAAEKKNKKGKPVVVPVPTGLAIVSSLLKGATDITLDSSSILTSSNDSGTDDDAINPTDTDTDAKTDINRGMMIQTATLIADALVETSYVRTITFSGSWSSSSSSSGTTKQDSQNSNGDNGTGTIVHDVLNKLLDGVLQNTSATTLILKDIHDFDRTVGCAFGSFLTRSSHNASNNNTNTTITKVILSNCTFQQSGFQAFVISLQHSMNTVTSLNVVDCSNFTTNDLDCISTTLVNTTILYNTYRNNTDRKINKMISSMMSPVLQSLKLSNINFHCLDMASVQYFFRAIQDATYITELDLSNNILGGTSTSGQPGLMPLLARCLAGTGTITNSKQRQQQHIERLILVDCSITRPSCLRQITNAIMMRSNDDSDDDSDEDNSADDTNTQQQQHKDKTDTANNNNDKVLPGGSSSNITYVDVSRNKFGNDGAKLLHELVVTNKSVTTLRMKHCSVGKYHMKLISDTLRINNNPFFYKLGISPDISLAILDSVNTMGNVVFGNKTNVSSSSNSVATSVTGGDGDYVDDDDDGSNAADGIFSRSPPTHRPHSYGGYYCGSGSTKKGTTTGSYGVTAAADDGDNKTTLMERFACN